MPTIDERIVEMRFENEQFEKGVKESSASLEQLKQSLRLEDSVKSVAKNLDDISYRFSIAGIAAEQLTKNITNSFYSMATNLKNTVMDLSFNQIGVGFDKYERKLQSVQTIINATGKSIDDVNVSLNKLNWFTDETSYDFTSMVDNIGKFTSNQIPLETAVTSMIGIADAAGLAGASVTDASHAMDGFSKAMGQGYMSRQNWQWIRTAHMDTAKFKEVLIDTALSLGTLKKNSKGVIKTLDGAEVSVANFEEGLKDKWMNVSVMNKALAQFGKTTEKIYDQYLETGDLTSDIIKRMGTDADDLGLKAFRAAQEAKTFTDAINSVKDAVSTGWMTSFEYIFGNYEEAKVMWTDLANEMWDVFNGGAEDRNEMLRSWHYDFKGYESMLRSIGNIWEGIKAAVAPITTAFRDLFPKTTADQLAAITEKFEVFSVNFKNFFTEAGSIVWPFVKEVDEMTDTVEDVVESVAEGAKEVVEVVEQVEGPVARTKKVLDELAYAVWRGDYGSGEARIKQLRKLGYSYELVQNRVNELIEAHDNLPKGYYKRHKVIEDEVKTVAKQVEAEKEVKDVVEEELNVIKEYVNDAPKKTHVVWNMYKAFTGLFTAARLVVDIFKAVVKGMAPLLKIGVQIFEIFMSIGSIIGQITTEIANYIRESGLLEAITDKLTKAFNKLSEMLQPVVDWFERMAWNMVSYIHKFKEFLKQVLALESVQTTIGYFKEFGLMIKNVVTENFKKFVGLAKDFVKINFKIPTLEDLLKFIDDMAKGFNTFIENLKEQDPTGAIKGWWGTLTTGAGGIWQSLLNTIQDPNSIFGKAFEAAKQFGMGLVKGLDSLNLDTILSILSTGSLAYFMYSFATAFRNISKAFKAVDFMQIDQLMTSIRNVVNSAAKTLKAKAFVEFAKGVGILALALIGLGQLDKEQLASVTVSIVAVILALKMLLNAMTANTLAKNASALNGIKSWLESIKWALTNAFMWQSFGLMLLAGASALLILAKAISEFIKIVSGNTANDIYDTGKMLVAILIGFLSFVVLVTQLTKKMNAAQKLGLGKIFIDLGIGLMAAAVGIKLATGPLIDLLKVIHTSSWGDVGALAFVIMSVASAVGALVWVLSVSGKKSGLQLISLAAGMAVMAIAIKALSPLLRDFWHWFTDFIKGNENFKNVNDVVYRALRIFTTLAIVATFASRGIKAMGSFLTGLGIAALGFGIGIRIAGDSLEAFARGFVGMLKIIQENAPLVIGTVAVIVSGILTALASQKGRLVFTIVSVLMAVVDAVSIAGPEIITAVGDQIQLAIDYTLGVLAEVVDVLVYALVQLINALADAIDTNRDPLLDAIGRLIQALHDLLKEGIKRVLPFMSDGFASAAASIGMFVAAAAPAIKVLGGISSALGKIKSAATKTLSYGKGTFDFLKEGLFGDLFNPNDPTKMGYTSGLVGVFGNVFNGLGKVGSGMAAYSGFNALAKDLGSKGMLLGLMATVGAVYGIGTALQNITDKENEEIRARNDLSQSHKKYIDRMAESYENYQAQTEAMQKDMADIISSNNGIQDLISQYDRLLDSSGKVKEGYEDQADLILDRLATALGVEKQYLQDLVTEHGNLQIAIGETLKKEEAMALLGSMQDEYSEALLNRSKHQVDETIGKYLMDDAKAALDEASRVKDYYESQMAKSQLAGDQGEYQKWNDLWLAQGVMVGQLQLNYDNLKVSHDEALALLQGDDKIINTYERMRDALVSGDAKSIADMLKYAESGIPEALKKANEASAEELAYQKKLFDKGYDDLLASANEGNAQITESVLQSARDASSAATTELLKKFGLFDEAGRFNGEAYTGAVKDELMKLSPEAVEYIETVLKPNLDVDTSEQGASTADTYKDGLLTALATNEDLSDQVSAIKNLFNIETTPEGEAASDEYLSGMITKLSSGEISLDSVIDMITEHFDISEETGKLGGDAVQAAADGATDNAETLNTAAEEVSQGGVDSGKAVVNTESPGIGKNFVKGVAQGMYDWASYIDEAASYIASKIPKTARMTLREKSPSRVGMEIVKFWNLGLAKGMTDNVSSIIEGSHTVSNTMIDSMRNAVGMAYSYLEGTGDLNPRITPVLDLSNIQNGTSALNGMFGNRSMYLAADGGLGFEQNRAEALARLQMDATNSDVVAALGLLRGDVNNLNDAFSNTQVVLDSGALVGATARQMDNALGRINTYRGRGI